MGYIGGMETAFGSGLGIQVLDSYEAMSRAAADSHLQRAKATAEFAALCFRRRDADAHL